MFFFLSILNIIILLFFLRITFKRTKNVFSPVNLFVYFALLPAISNLYFSLNTDSFESIVFNQIYFKYHDYTFVYYALFLTIIVNIIIYFGIVSGLQSKNTLIPIFLGFIFNKLIKPNSDLLHRKYYYSSIFTFISGLIVYLIFVNKMGGLVNIWENLNLRSTKNAGLGYYQTYYTHSINFSCLYLYWYFTKRNKIFYRFLIVTLTAFVSLSIGARGPLIILIISIFIVNHFLVKKRVNLLNLNSFILIPFLVFFILSFLQFRKNPLSYYIDDYKAFTNGIVDDFESGFVARVGRMERDIVILGYFNENDFWYGKSYMGLMYAPIPRSIFPEKPPVDSGMYLRSIADGNKITPPMPVNQLSGSSWPEHNWVGYMNFGLFGLIFINYLSGYIYGSIYKFVRNNYFNIFLTSFMALFFVGGIPILSPPGLVKIFTFLIVIFLTSLFFYPKN